MSGAEALLVTTEACRPVTVRSPPSGPPLPRFAKPPYQAISISRKAMAAAHVRLCCSVRSVDGHAPGREPQMHIVVVSGDF